MVGYKGTKENFMHSYIDGYVNFNPFWPHVLDFWQLRNEHNIFFTSYEYMKQDLATVIKDVCHFLNKELREDYLMQLIDHLSFDKMKDNPSCNHVKEFESMKAASGRKVEEFRLVAVYSHPIYLSFLTIYFSRFVRRGIVGSHKDELPSCVIHEFDEWSDDNLKHYNLSVGDFVNYSKY